MLKVSTPLLLFHVKVALPGYDTSIGVEIVGFLGSGCTTSMLLHPEFPPALYASTPKVPFSPIFNAVIVAIVEVVSLTSESLVLTAE